MTNRWTPKNGIGDCHWCGAKNVPLGATFIGRAPYTRFDTNSQDVCLLCYGSRASSVIEFGGDEHIVLRTICFIGNEILRLLREGKQ